MEEENRNRLEHHWHGNWYFSVPLSLLKIYVDNMNFLILWFGRKTLFSSSRWKRCASPEPPGQCLLHFIYVFTIKQGADKIDKEDTTQELARQQPPNSLGDAKSSRVWRLFSGARLIHINMLIDIKVTSYMPLITPWSAGGGVFDKASAEWRRIFLSDFSFSSCASKSNQSSLRVLFLCDCV